MTVKGVAVEKRGAPSGVARLARARVDRKSRLKILEALERSAGYPHALRGEAISEMARGGAP